MRQPGFPIDARVTVTDTEARTYNGVIRSHYVRRGGWWYVVWIDELDEAYPFPEAKVQQAPAPAGSTDPGPAEARPS